MALIPTAEAQARMFALKEALPVETVPLLDARGRYAAGDILSKRTQPALDLSAMDGYAIRFAERPGPWTVAGESAAGGGLGRALAPGEAARIFTGAPVPEGADSILIQEEAGRDGDSLTMTGEGPPRIGAHIRRKGSDFAEGDILIPAGAPIGAAAIALAASGGHGALPVRRRPRVAILSTGNELVPAGEPTTGALLPASNGPMLAALLAGTPAQVTDHGIIRDDLGLISAAFADLAGGADIIVTTGGASVGDHDLVLPALEQAGATIDFWKVRMKPGKPVMIGTLGGAIVLGLPGNPVSAFVTATLFLKPLIAHLLGSARPVPPPAAARLGEALPATGGRAEYLRGKWSRGLAVPTASQDSAGLAALVEAELLIVRESDSPALEAGADVEIIPLA
ncbi:gephyrin-like molybdotransferase Glp [Rhizorhabdus dicambivorans]|uniref:Molybdopterin molybdenumtransferase n=1 Tax=Rhizorhabdus dicambivorans TaxID=1850238 RepID=A0A2A4G0D9_9SPHN|nr:gephyrin-like molybdotransferase Glp [Rhizorhabdus dicambivorans]ATE63052.1 molybdopterin molybdenumtransferase MoeA [Rhizorhabdus dicambivorans]PCE43229.1 molybdopterin molybdenumtransferase MoeA [Rhizorhabdus dicambivorans]